MTKTIPVSEAKDKLSFLVQDTAATCRHYIITVSGRDEAVLMSKYEYESLMETIEILKDQSLMKKIAASMEEIRRGDVSNFDDFKQDV